MNPSESPLKNIIRRSVSEWDLFILLDLIECISWINVNVFKDIVFLMFLLYFNEY